MDKVLIYKIVVKNRDKDQKDVIRFINIKDIQLIEKYFSYEKDGPKEDEFIKSVIRMRDGCDTYSSMTPEQLIEDLDFKFSEFIYK